ncbi:HAMP domain-containing histidine kinase [Peribacillus muralis]|uniref:sensor histidine kinase n=1 Tax=Peribacillus muralis TaxID=264697 RepID=UPI001F4E87C9|nr:sensor histidine kinase [Peribacillus muralis]MCK1991939.1 sensor histidine kinase [Peribacillus muralis]MCK2012497.1 sensor histidine kinase [Peribacillus muralis]
MIRKYVAERISWITFFISLHLFIIFVAYLDSALPVKPIMYIVFLSLIMFCIFLIFRYKKETNFYKRLEAREDNLDLSNIAEPDSPFEKIIESSIITQTELLKQAAEKSRMTLEQEKDELLAWIHEVKTPLTAMHLMIDRLDEGMLKSHLTYEWLRIHLLLDQQLHQGRIPFIENDLYMENTDLETVIFDEIKTLQSWCIQKGIGFDIQLDVTEVLTDAKWLSFIMRQLLTNSIKYSESADIMIISHEQAGQTVVEVKDSGRGIDSKDVSRIFDKGFTSTSNHRDSAATGMGLYLTKKAADSLLISIDVKSELGAGTTMTLRFPKRNDFVNITSM